ncbi:MAG: hybrid sensor histidine kinase/response regulator [Gemmatimonadaceae bacterium]
MKERILVVEDSATQAAALAHLLEQQGYDVVVARAGERAMELLRNDRFDLVLSDVVMPDISGYDVARRVKADPKLRDLPVVLLTSLNDPLAIVRGVASGADSYVTKPYLPERLLARVRTAIDRPRRAADAAPAVPVDVTLLGSTFTIAADTEHILGLVVLSYEDLMLTSAAVRAAERRARFLADAGELLSASNDGDQVLKDLARLAVPSIADVCIVDALDADGSLRRVEVVRADSSMAELTALLATPMADGELPLSITLASQRAFLDFPDVTTVAGSALTALGVRSFISAPLMARDETLGALILLSASRDHTYGDDDLDLATDLARRAALAVDNARLYQQAQQATRARDDVLGIVSHDLRNPLNTINMAATFLLEVIGPAGLMIPAGTPDGAPLSLPPKLDIIVRAVKRANSLIEDLLDVTRIDAKRLAVDPAMIDGQSLLDEALADAGSPDIAVTYGWEGEAARVSADRGRIFQVFSNLIGNALKFTPKGGRIDVRGRMIGDEALFTIADTGAGIPPENLPHLFDRFWQARETRRAGAGLGLYIAKGIIEAHGGRLWVESTLGVGTTFSFTLPRTPAPQALVMTSSGARSNS